MPALTLGCGAVGGSSTSDNIGVENLFNLRRVAYGVRDLEEIRQEFGQTSTICGYFLRNNQSRRTSKCRGSSSFSSLKLTRNERVRVKQINYWFRVWDLSQIANCPKFLKIKHTS